MFLILLMNFLFATTFIIGKAVLSYSSPVVFIAFRMFFAGLLLITYQFFTSKIQIKKTDIKLFLLLTLMHIYIPYVFEFIALKYVSAAKAALFFNLAPFITALFAFLFINERLSNKKILGLIIGFFGFLPILLSQSSSEMQLGEILFFSWPEVFLIISVASASFAWIAIQNSMQKQGYSLITLNGISMFFAGILSFLTAPLIETVKIWHFNNFIVLTIMIIIIGNIICYNVYGYLLQKYSATFVSFTGFTIPIFTAILQFIFFKELVSLAFIISTILITFGLFLFYQDENSRN